MQAVLSDGVHAFFVRGEEEPHRIPRLPRPERALPSARGGGAAVGQQGPEPGTGTQDLAAALAAARAGEPDAFAALYRAPERDVRRLCRRLLGDEAAAEDAAADCFLRVRERIEGYDPARPFRPWLLGIAAHRCVDELRRRARDARLLEQAPEALVDPSAGEAASPLRRVLRAEERTALLAAVDALPERYRVPLVLRHFADLDYAAIGEALGVPGGQVGSLLLRGRRRLREALGRTRS